MYIQTQETLKKEISVKKDTISPSHSAQMLCRNVYEWIKKTCEKGELLQLVFVNDQ